jgi:hypothetical protein
VSAYEATVEVLTAEVRVLMVGSRQVTLSVAKQLDQVDPDDIEPFGRIRTGARLPFAATGMIEVIGKADDGSLVRSTEVRESYRCDRASENQRVTFNGRDCITLRCPEHPTGGDHFWDSDPDVLDEWETLPLIVLAGLR